MNRIALRMAAAVAIGVGCGAPAPAALIAFYPFSGNANDATGNGNNGTVNGATLTAAGYEGQAYEFDGVNDFISIPVDLNPATRPQLTIGGWANPDAVNAIRAVISHDNGGFDRNLNIDIRGPGSGFRYSAFTGAGVTSAGPDPAPVGQWVFVAARYDAVAGTVTLDVDGSRVTVAATPGSGFATARIGSNPAFAPGFGEMFDGRIDNVFIYDEVLGDARIDEIRRGGAEAILPAAVPEPASVALLGVGAAGLAGRRFRRLTGR